MPTQEQIAALRELNLRRDKLSPDKIAVLDELGKRFGIESSDPMNLKNQAPYQGGSWDRAAMMPTTGLTEIGRQFTEPGRKYLETKANEGRVPFSETVGGAFNALATVPGAAMSPLMAIPGGETAMRALNSPFEVARGLFQAGKQVVGALTPSFVPDTPLGPEMTRATETIGASAIVPPLVKGAAKSLPTPRNIARMSILDPEVLMNDAMKANIAPLARSTQEFFDLRSRVNKRALAEGHVISGSYRGSKAKLQKVEGLINKDAEALQSELAKMEVAGFRFSTKQAADAAYKYAAERMSTEAAGGGKLDALRRERDDFLQRQPKQMTPTEMEAMKVGSQRAARYGPDVTSAAKNDWNQAIAYELRNQLETWDKSGRLKALNDRIFERKVIRDVEYGLATKGGIPTSMTSLPFYMAVAEPVRGAALTLGRSLFKSPAILSRTALAVDRLRGSTVVPAVPDAVSVGGMMQTQPKQLPARTGPIAIPEGGFPERPAPTGANTEITTGPMLPGGQGVAGFPYHWGKTRKNIIYPPWKKR